LFITSKTTIMITASILSKVDMGGSSTQIVFLTEQIDNGTHQCTRPPTSESAEYKEEEEKGEEDYAYTCPSHLARQQGEQFFSSSYRDTKFADNPCGFRGHQVTWDGYTLLGTGNAEECTKQVQSLLPHPEKAVDNHDVQSGRIVGGIENPAVRGRHVFVLFRAR
jgi:GDA1/CD39 (nucleoside phosphatase) family